ncbi:hypothetical protein BG015_008890 [Linnemannia schmuckeri]|uniref:F-box domain-containing protein n=1 Tax=Linnemannia schmuckeri TaxID=64567 RepID=A0A9P5RWA0_9FUNG|nr:hypothetical protein BG015_008890 [Linnemannia schmuckeri]
MQNTSTVPVWASLSDLPREIIDITIPRIPSKDYASCVGVSPAWPATFIPSLWKIVHLVDRTMHNCFGSKEARNAFIRNCQHIRTIETTNPAFVSFLGHFHPRITKLESLTLRLKEHPFSKIRELIISCDATIPAALIIGQEYVDVPRHASRVMEVLQNNPNQRLLRLDLSCFRYKNGKKGFPDLVSEFPTAHLKKLELSFLNPSPHDKDIHDGSDKDLNLETMAHFNQFFQNPSMP